VLLATAALASRRVNASPATHGAAIRPMTMRTTTIITAATMLVVTRPWALVGTMTAGAVAALGATMIAGLIVLAAEIAFAPTLASAIGRRAVAE